MDARSQQFDEATATTETASVWVYRYIFWDEHAQAHKTSKRYATDDAIRLGLGVRIDTSGKRVPVDTLIDGAFSD